MSNITISEVGALSDISNYKQYIVRGRVESVRNMSSVVFFDLYDGTGYLQIAAIKKNVELTLEFCTKSIVECLGCITKTKSGELTLFLTKTPIVHSIPTEIKKNNLSSFSKNSEEMLINRSFRNNHIARMDFLSRCRKYFQDTGYLEAETSILNHVEVGGRAKLFSTFSTELEKYLYLRGTAEIQLKQLSISTLRPVYEIAKLFRNQSAGVIEFTLLETIHPWINFKEKSVFLYKLLSYALEDLPIKSPVSHERIRNLCDRQYKIVDCVSYFKDEYKLDVLNDDLIYVVKAVNRLGLNIEFQSSEGAGNSIKYREKIFFKLAGHYANEYEETPVILKNFPSSFSPLAKRLESNDMYCSLGYLFLKGTRVCEIVEEENNYYRQECNFLKQIKEKEGGAGERVQKDLLVSLANGAPPMSGIGLNINRLFSVLLETRRLSEIVSFPISQSVIAKSK